MNKEILKIASRFQSLIKGAEYEEEWEEVERREKEEYNKDIVMSTLEDLTEERQKGYLFPPSVVREESGLDKESFDRAAVELFKEDKIVLHHHDFAQSLSQEQRDDLIKSPKGTYFAGIALRSGR